MNCFCRWGSRVNLTLGESVLRGSAAYLKLVLGAMLFLMYSYELLNPIVDLGTKCEDTAVVKIYRRTESQ